MAEREVPDGGFGWAVIAGLFSTLLVALGLQYSFGAPSNVHLWATVCQSHVFSRNTDACAGVLYVALLADFQSDRGTTAWVGSVSVGAFLGFGARMCCCLSFAPLRRVVHMRFHLQASRLDTW
jgi:hypothetical protein